MSCPVEGVAGLFLWLVMHMLFRFLGLLLGEGEGLNQEEKQPRLLNVFQCKSFI